MNFMTRLKQKKNHIWALGLTFVLCAGIGIFFDYYYAMNDDVMMKDILAGIYTGTPEGRNIQMLFPIGWLISLFYRVVRGMPWYGIFLCVCHFGSIYLLTNRLLIFFHKSWTKAIAVVIEAGLIITLLLQELVFAQYTVTSTLLAATAAFLFYTTETEGTVKDYFCKNIVSIVLVTLSFQIRSEMLLLVLPLICVTGLCRWACEKPFFTKENAAKYLSVFGGILAGLALSQGIHMVAYAGMDWQEFNRYFDNRTDLYDFLWRWHPIYEENREFYESIGMTESSQKLIENYNFGFDEDIDADLLEKINENARERRKEQAPFTDTLKQACILYKYRTFHETDFPWNLFVIVLYAMVLLAALGNKHFRFFGELFCMGIVRTGLWMFILYRGRDPERITHSLYLMEFVILTAFLLVECKKESRGFTFVKAGLMGALALLCLYNVTGSVEKVQEKYAVQEETDEEWKALQAYIEGRQENFYFVDVYSTVKYSEKMFESRDNAIANYDIMGGWVSKSPLTTQKFRYFGMTSMEQAVLEQKNVYVVDRYGDWNWLVNYYRENGIEISLQKIDSIRVGGKEVFGVYTVQKK